MRSTLAVLLPLLATTPLAAQRLLAWDSTVSPIAVHEVDVATGARTLFRYVTANAGGVGGAAYDRLAGKVYMSSTSFDSLFVFDMTNGAATLVGGHGIGPGAFMHGLEWDSSTSTLYGLAKRDNCLYTISTTTGLATLVGPTGIAPALASFCNIGHHAVANVLFMTETWSASTYTIDRATGLATLVGPLNGPTNPGGLAFNSDDGLLYLVDNLADTLHTIDPLSGAATLVGSMGASNCIGLAYVPGAGRLTRTFASCGAANIAVTGHPAPGSTIATTIGNVTGFPFSGLGTTALGLPFCGCPIGHDWALALAGPNLSLPIPPNPTLVGAQVFIQGMDFFGTGGCANPQFTLTDTITVTIG